MKKQYISPEAITIKLETQKHMLFGSDSGEGQLNGGGNRGDYSGNQLSRGGNSFFDDEE